MHKEAHVLVHIQTDAIDVEGGGLGQFDGVEVLVVLADAQTDVVGADADGGGLVELVVGFEDVFAIDDDFKEELVKADIEDAQRHALIGSMDLTTLPDAPGRAAVIAPILERVDRPLPKLSADQAKLLIENAGTVRSKISLLNKANKLLPDEMVRAIMAALPEPYSRIRKGYYTPYLEPTAENLELVAWLDDRDIISSWSRGILSGDIRVNLKRR